MADQATPQQEAPDGHTVSRRALIEAIVASTVGTTIEWYDFFLYGTAAAIVFPHVFFPRLDDFAGRLAALSTFTVGFLARPLGAVVFGYMGDRLGRKSTLVATLLLMGASTVVIGCLPTYDQIGILAPIILTMLRFLQGLGVGGEWGGAVLLALESGHRGKRGFYASWPQAGVPLGLLASTGAMALLEQKLTAEAFLSWGWRVPFLASAVLIVIGFVIRTRIEETPLFAELKHTNRTAHAPVRETLKLFWKEVLLAAGTRVCENASFYIFTVSVLGYAERSLGIPRHTVLTAINIAAVAQFFTIPIFGILSDYLLRRRIYAAACVFMLVFAFPYYALLGTAMNGWIVAAVVVSLAVGHAPLYAVQASLIPELFGTRVRYTGASIGYQLGAPLAGGIAPLIATSLEAYFPGRYWPLAVYLMVIALISLVSVLFLSETSRKDIRLDKLAAP